MKFILALFLIMGSLSGCSSDVEQVVWKPGMCFTSDSLIYKIRKIHKDEENTTYTVEWVGTKSTYLVHRSHLAFVEPADCITFDKEYLAAKLSRLETLVENLKCRITDLEKNAKKR